MKIKVKVGKIIVCLLVVILSYTCISHASVPRVISFQGKASEKSGLPLSGTYGITFRVYNQETAGASIWQEAHANAEINNGIFHVLLGSVEPLDLPFDENYWISIEINNDGEMVPRKRLASVGYAIKAEVADTLSADPVIPFYKNGFDIQLVDLNTVRISQGVMDVAGKMYTTSAPSSELPLQDLIHPENSPWVHGSKTNDSLVYIYTYINEDVLAFAFSDEGPNKSDHQGTTAIRPFNYRRYPDTDEGIYYRCLGVVYVNTLRVISGVKNRESSKAQSLFTNFGGNGQNGAIHIDSDRLFSDLTGSTENYRLQTTDLTLDAGAKITVDTGWAYIAVKGVCTISGTIDANGQGCIGGNESGDMYSQDGYAGANAYGGGGASIQARGVLSQNGIFDLIVTENYERFPSTQNIVAMSLAGAGGGGGGGYGPTPAEGFGGKGGCGGGARSYGGCGGEIAENWDYGDGEAGGNTDCGIDERITALTGKSVNDTISMSCAYDSILPLILTYGRGGGGGGAASDVVKSRGGNGGGVIYIECDTLVFDGILTANGEDTLEVSRTYCGSGGGGGGGTIVVRARVIEQKNGQIYVNGGNAGTSVGISKGQGGDGEAGFTDIVLVW